ncbi:MAG: T9SS type A sorting domain-containing protein, partial [Bacteroidales bacterium]|nr:T9SS type A sorting domain-containing protein [Bacteroidales bacterium]
ETCTVYIFDLTGLLVLSCILNPSNTSINVNNLTKGIYLVKVMNSTAKFIKL